jgi:hypothetical protein
MEYPVCPLCFDQGRLGNMVPLSDTSKQGTEIGIKMWVCTNPDCKLSIIQRGGDPYWNMKTPGIE